jgi:hypothetical protein
MNRISLLILSIIFLATSNVNADTGKLRGSVGLDYLTGDYGSTINTDIAALTFGLRYKKSRWTFKASIPYLSISNTGVTTDGVSVNAAGKSEKGPGDLNLSASYLGYYNPKSGFGISGKTKIKLPVADKNKGLGTGEVDVSFQLDPFKVMGPVTLFSSIGYKVYGDTATTDYNNVWYLSLGGMYKVSDALDIGLGGNFREKVTTRSENKKDMFLFSNSKLTRTDAIQFHLSHGFSDSTPDWGAGLLYKRKF